MSWFKTFRILRFEAHFHTVTLGERGNSFSEKPPRAEVETIYFVGKCTNWDMTDILKLINELISFTEYPPDTCSDEKTLRKCPGNFLITHHLTWFQSMLLESFTHFIWKFWTYFHFKPKLNREGVNSFELVSSSFRIAGYPPSSACFDNTIIIEIFSLEIF